MTMAGDGKERDMTMAAKREERTVSMLMALTGEA